MTYAVFPTPQAGLGLPTNRILFPGSSEFSTGPMISAEPGSASGLWISANDPLALPFVLRTAGVVTQLGWLNGSAAGGGVDLGVYSTSWARLISTGAQTGSGNSAWQWINVTDTPLSAGRYYLVMARDNTTTNRQFFCGHQALTSLMGLMGCQDSATDAYPLPDPLTNMAPCATFTRVPICGVAMREIYT